LMGATIGEVESLAALNIRSIAACSRCVSHKRAIVSHNRRISSEGSEEVEVKFEGLREGVILDKRCVVDEVEKDRIEERDACEERERERKRQEEEEGTEAEEEATCEPESANEDSGEKCGKREAAISRVG